MFNVLFKLNYMFNIFILYFKTYVYIDKKYSLMEGCHY